MGSSPRSPAQLWVAHEHTRTPRSVGRSVGPVLRQPPLRQTRPPPRAGVLFLFLCISPFAEIPSCFRGTPACALGLTRVPLRDGCVFLLSSHTFNPPSLLSALRTRRSLPFGENTSSTRATGPLPPHLSPPPHGCGLCSRPSAHVRPCRGMGTRAHPSPSRAALAKEASDRHWISVPFVALSSRNLSSLPCLDHCGPHPTQHTLSPRPCGSWVPRSH